jgi:2-polyprenyl-6-methoxyphenol hydroxylase-like FAD-dependent oxidoreductase
MTTLFSSQGNELGELNFGAWAWNKTWYEFVCVMRTYLQDVMLDTARKEGVQIQYDKKMVSIEGSDREVTVNFSDGTKDTADLLLGCDGIHFSVQTLYIDPQTVPEYSGISTVFSFVPMSDLLPTASAITDIHFIMTPDGAVALMPWTASGATLFWFFSYQVTVPASGNTRDGWEEHRGAEVEGFKTTLLKILQGVEGDCGTLKTGCESYRNCEILPYFQTPFWWEVV